MRVRYLATVLVVSLAFGSTAYAKEDTDTYISEEIQEECYLAAMEYDICPEVLMALIEKESSGKANATSKNGKYIGLCQLSKKYFGGDGIDLYDPHTNIFLAAEYLNKLHAKYEDIADALDAYGGYNPNNDEVSKYARSILERSDELERVHGK